MAKNWYVGVAEHSRDTLAETELEQRGVRTCFPKTYSRETVADGKRIKSWGFLHPPYFFARFDGTDNEEYNFVLSQRGVAHFLTNSRSEPESIPSSIIAAHERRELLERHNSCLKRKDEIGGLLVGKPYTIMRPALWAGKIGKLIAVEHGKARLDCGGVLVTVDTVDLAFAESPKARAAR